MPEMQFVLSSHIVSWGYENGEFHVRYGPTINHPAGRTAIYYDVPPEVAESVMASPSAGQAVRAHLKDNFRWDYLS